MKGVRRHLGLADGRAQWIDENPLPAAYFLTARLIWREHLSQTGSWAHETIDDFILWLDIWKAIRSALAQKVEVLLDYPQHLTVRDHIIRMKVALEDHVARGVNQFWVGGCLLLDQDDYDVDSEVGEGAGDKRVAA